MKLKLLAILTLAGALSVYADNGNHNDDSHPEDHHGNDDHPGESHSSSNSAPSVFHWQETVIMSASTVETGATGKVQAQVKKEGRNYRQTLDVKVGGLQSNTTYQLWAQTNGAALFQVNSFTTGREGKKNLRFEKKSNGRGNSLPAALDPLGAIDALEVRNGGALTVLTANMSAPTNLVYQVVKRLTNDGVETAARGEVHINATLARTVFKLKAAKLQAANYFVSFNGTIATNLATFGNGNLTLNTLPAGAPAALDILSLAVRNAQSNSVLSAAIP